MASGKKKGESDQRVGSLPMLQFPQVSALHTALAPQEAGFKGLLVHLSYPSPQRDYSLFFGRQANVSREARRRLDLTSQGCFFGKKDVSSLTILECSLTCIFLI